MEVALNLLANKNLPLIPELVEPAIIQSSPIPAVANQMTCLYKRLASERFRVLIVRNLN